MCFGFVWVGTRGPFGRPSSCRSLSLALDVVTAWRLPPALGCEPGHSYQDALREAIVSSPAQVGQPWAPSFQGWVSRGLFAAWWYGSRHRAFAWARLFAGLHKLPKRLGKRRCVVACRRAVFVLACHSHFRCFVCGRGRLYRFRRFFCQFVFSSASVMEGRCAAEADLSDMSLEQKLAFSDFCAVKFPCQVIQGLLFLSGLML